MKSLVTAFAFLALSLTATACATSAPADDEAVAAASGMETLICRERLVIGSNQHQRVCLTEEQWARLARREAAVYQAMTLRLQGSNYSY
jgi:hypothetical protein